MAETWGEISREIDNHAGNERTARDVKKQLADHAWCTLLVALIRRLEQFNEAAQALSDRGREFIQRAMTEHGDGLGLVSDGIRAQVTTLLTAWWQRRDPEANA